jgi:hypothetical protein
MSARDGNKAGARLPALIPVGIVGLVLRSFRISATAPGTDLPNRTDVMSHKRLMVGICAA